MGTNYYAGKPEDRCEHCGRSGEADELHIGKSSGGWAFAVEIHPEHGIHNLSDWEARFSSPDIQIRDEYGSVLTAEQMLDVIKNRKRPKPEAKPTMYASWEEFHRLNDSYLGPHNLLFANRGKERGETWECFDQEFS